ncbi:MAG: TonB-dependent receptor [Bacteroidales bacterium]|nr:TonB-dependent receptor [Bacteroidales bacterium]
MKRPLVVLMLLFLGMQITLAQGRVVTGKVTSSEDGTAIPGVTISIIGTSRGVTTDLDGNYEISVPGDQSVLRFSFVGYKSQEITVGQSSTINVVLEPDLFGLEEVVVIGYGTSSKESLTGAVEVVGSERLEMLPAASLENALQGGVTGLLMSSGDGQPGAGSQINIRGIGSINASSEPLYVIDGIPVQQQDISPTDFSNGGQSSSIMSTLNPNDIESISVLKDASATAIYGSRGANGVIIITTKSGGKGDAKINFSGQVGVSDQAYNNLRDGLNAAQYKELFIEGYVNRGEDVETATTRFYDWFPGADTIDTDWIDLVYNPGMTQQYNLDASGGNDKILYFVSAGYYNQEGVVIGTSFERFSTRLNLSADLTDRLKITNNITFGNTSANGSEDRTAWNNPMHNGFMCPPVVPLYNEDGLYYGDHLIVGMDGNNPVGNQFDDERWQKQNRLIDNFTASYKIMDFLTFKTAWSFDMINVREFQYLNTRYGGARLVGGSGEEGTTYSFNWIGTQTMNYNKTFAENHSIDALLGFEAQKYDARSVRAYAEGYPNPTLRTLANAANPMAATSSGSQYSFMSMFSRFSYNYSGKYYITASFRRDGSSRFGEDSRWGNFWSLGGSWRVTQEDFMESLTWLDNLKLRVSYGITGNASIGNFDAIALYGFGYDYDQTPGSAPSNVGNPLLTWEGQSTLDIGMDFSVFDRLSATVTYFHRKNTDLLLNRPLSSTTGFSDNTQNVGDMLNKGLELETNFKLINSSALKWDLGFNITWLKNEVTRLDEPIANGTFLHTEGHDFYEFWLYQWAGVNPMTGAAMWYVDETMTTTTENLRGEANKVFTGKSATPSSFGGLNTNISYKGFTLSAQVAFVWDKYIWDNQAGGIESDGARSPRSTTLYQYENRWTTPGEESLLPIFVWGNTSRSNEKRQTRYLYDATYVRLRDITLTYNFNSSVTERLKMSSLAVFVKANNYLTWVRDRDKLQIDPEAGLNGVVNGIVPKTKTLSFGVNVGF